MKRTFVLVCLLTITMLLAVGCPAPTPVVVEKEKVVEKPVVQTVVVEKVVEKEVVVTPTPAPVETIRIGGIGPLSAPGTVVGGIAMQFAMNLAVKDINEAGGILGKPVELIFADTEGLPERGAAVAERLINENKVVAITGEYHSSVGLAVMEVAHKYGVPVLFSETWSDKITEAGYPEVFRIAPASSMVARSVVDWMAEVGVKRVVLIAETTDFGTGMAEKQKKLLEEEGIEVLETFFVEMGTTDFTPILTRIQAMDPPPDVVSAEAVTGETSYNLEQQMAEMGIAPSKTTIGIANQVAVQPEFWESVPDGNYFVFTHVGLPPTLYNDTTRRVAKAYYDQFQTEPPSYALEAYDSLWILADAIERAGSTDPQAIITALEGTDIVLAQGHYWFKYGSHNPLPTDGSVPAFMWHQWPDPATLVVQYFEPNQDWGDAAVIWPPVYQTHGTAYIPYGEKP
ncbi:MAG TPA: ABC transporter substrate-binding protein [Anaerolineae bacterium]|nr:ABC transporter substrate-binding protein [Anaerolineae bacterium]